MERSNFPHRNLGEDDEELLNGIWAGLEMPDDRPDADDRDFDDVKRRIRRRVRRRWMSRATLAERLGRIYGIRVEVAARLGEYTFSGKIRQDRGVEYILNLLSETSDVICKVENGVMRLS